MPRYNEPPTAGEMEEPPVAGLDCVCRYEDGIVLCPLHAAAPDLLAACEAAWEAAESVGALCNVEPPPSVEQQVRAALALAKGA